MSDALEEIFVVTAPGLEGLLADEARETGLDVTGTTPGGVTLSGGWPEVWRANMDLRGAVRVLARVAVFRTMHLAQLDKRARKLPWENWLKPHVPVRVEATCRKSRIYHAKAAAQRIEGALEAAGIALAPDASIVLKLRIEDDLATLSLDTSGASLHKRGLKVRVNKAPMRENLAALFLRAAGYDGSMPVYDPMCGSGTFVLEAAEMAMGLQPGRARRFAFEELASYDPQRVDALRREKSVGAPVQFHGTDRDDGAVRMSIENAERSGLSGITRFACSAIGGATPPDGPPGLVITNPPYGGRIGKKGVLHGLYGSFGKVMRERFQGWKVAMVTSDAGLAKSTTLDWDQPGPIVDHGGTKIRLWQVQL